MHRENVALLARYQSGAFHTVCSACFQGTSVKCNDTVPRRLAKPPGSTSPVQPAPATPSHRNVIHHQRHFLRLCRLYAGISINSSAAIHCFICISLPCHNHCGGSQFVPVPSVSASGSAVKLSSRFPARRFAAPVAIFLPVFYYTDDALTSPYHPLKRHWLSSLIRHRSSGGLKGSAYRLKGTM